MHNGVYGGEYLEYSVRWPSNMTNAEEMHRQWLQGDCDGKILEFYQPTVTLSNLSRNRERENEVRPTAHIPLPFEVESRFNYYVLKSPISSALVLYIHLRAPAKQQFHLENEKDIEFE